MEQRTCNKCGKTFDMWDEQNDFSFHKHVGYGSKYDMSRIELDLCCDCFDELMDYIAQMCKKSPIREEYEI